MVEIANQMYRNFDKHDTRENQMQERHSAATARTRPSLWPTRREPDEEHLEVAQQVV